MGLTANNCELCLSTIARRSLPRLPALFCVRRDSAIVARRNSSKKVGVVEAKARVLELIAMGSKVTPAMASVERTFETYRDWYKHDEKFNAEIKRIREQRAEIKMDGRQEVPDFDVFCDVYLHEPLFPHQYNAWDVLEGRPPRYMDPAITYEPGESSRIIMNFPPNHGKTTTFSINYVVWRIHKNPGISIAIVSKGQGYAKKILSAVKARLTSNAYRNMHLKFAPEGGWRDSDQSWTQTTIYVTGKYDGETEKDPTVEAVGMGGQIYGGRFDIIILDDVVDNENAHRWDEQSDWTMTILDSRLPPDGGLMMVLGTRLATTDLYAALREKEDENEQQFFSYLAQPAVLAYSESRETWRTLWPFQLGHRNAEDSALRCMACYTLADPDVSIQNCCGFEDVRWLKVRWDGNRLAKKRFPLGERRWSLVWQQQQIPADATFNQRTVMTAINRSRQPGTMRAGVMGHRTQGMQGLYVVGGLDPATIGNTAIIVSGIERQSKKRFVLDGFNQANTSPSTMREQIKRLTDLHHINEWVIERNAFQKFLTDDPEIRAFLQSRSCRLTPHYTTKDKVDPDFGVMAMAPLFESTGRPPKNNGGGTWAKVAEGDLIELPDERQSAVFSQLVAQLIAWEPQGMSQKQKTDLVMALWFTEIGFRKIVSTQKQATTHLDNPFLSRGRKRDRVVINIADYREAMRLEKEAA